MIKLVLALSLQLFGNDKGRQDWKNQVRGTGMYIQAKRTNESKRVTERRARKYENGNKRAGSFRNTNIWEKEIDERINRNTSYQLFLTARGANEERVSIAARGTQVDVLAGSRRKRPSVKFDSCRNTVRIRFTARLDSFLSSSFHPICIFQIRSLFPYWFQFSVSFPFPLIYSL